jgi:hypothetical protein
MAESASASTLWEPLPGLTADRLRAVAPAVFWLLLRPHDWVHRRVESVTFTDVSTVRRRVSVDFTLPHGLPAVTKPDGKRIQLVPLTLLAKRRLRRFDLRDEQGRSLPLLTATQNGAVATAMLEALAESILRDGELNDEVRSILQRIAAHEPRGAEAALLELRAATGPQREILRHLNHEPQFYALAQDLALNFAALTFLAESDGVRRIVKFAYDERPSHGFLKGKAIEQLGWRASEFRFVTPSVDDAQSYHFEIEAPIELGIVTASLDVKGPTGETWGDADDGVLRTAHLYVSDVSRGARGIATVKLLPRRAGLVRSSMLATVFVASVLTWARFHLLSLSTDVDGAIPLLLALPGLLAAYTARPGEHALATEMLLGLRALVLGSGLCSFMAAGALAGRLAPSTLAGTWTTLLVTAWILVALVSVNWLVPRRTR